MKADPVHRSLNTYQSLAAAVTIKNGPLFALGEIYLRDTLNHEHKDSRQLTCCF